MGRAGLALSQWLLTRLRCNSLVCFDVITIQLIKDNGIYNIDDEAKISFFAVTVWLFLLFEHQRTHLNF
jgi:hypothetical protein